MIETGVIVEQRPDGAVTVEVERGAACDGCHTRGACAMTFGRRRLLLPATNPLGASVGQRITLELDDSAFLTACVTVYLIPLATLLAAAFCTWAALGGTPLASHRDPLSALGALAGAAAGFGIVRLIDSRIRDPRRPDARRFRARITGIFQDRGMDHAS
jgi:sigma-E factor negative regulatory protein RseC